MPIMTQKRPHSTHIIYINAPTGGGGGYAEATVVFTVAKHLIAFIESSPCCKAVNDKCNNGLAGRINEGSIKV